MRICKGLPRNYGILDARCNKQFVCYAENLIQGLSKCFRTGRLERKLQMVQLSATMCSSVAILWVSLVSFVALTLCVASQRVFVFISLSTRSGNFWIRPCFKLHSLYSSSNVVRVSKWGKLGGRDMWHTWGRGEEFIGFWLGGPKGRDHWEDLGVGGWITLTWTLGR
jgi:hypothetical protein